MFKILMSASFCCPNLGISKFLRIKAFCFVLTQVQIAVVQQVQVVIQSK